MRIDKLASIEIEQGAYFLQEEGVALELPRREGGIRMAEGALDGINPLLSEEFPNDFVAE